jgi:hypothetical protein
MERFGKLISTVTGLISVVMLIASLVWGKDFQNNSKYEFTLYYLSHIKFELVVVIMLCVIFYFNKQIRAFIKKFFESIKAVSSFAYTVAIVNVVIICLVSIQFLRTLSRSRMVYHRNLFENYQLSQFQMANVMEQKGEIVRSINQFKKLQKLYHFEGGEGDALMFSDRINRLKARVNLSQAYFADFTASIRENGLTPINFNVLVQSFIFAPDNEIIRAELVMRIKEILSSTTLSSTLYEDCKANQDARVKQTLNRYKGFFIENGLIGHAYLSDQYVQEFKRLVTLKDAKSYTEYINKLWNIRNVRDLEVYLNSR